MSIVRLTRIIAVASFGYALAGAVSAQGGKSEPLNGNLEPCSRKQAVYFRTYVGLVNGLHAVRIEDRNGSLKAEGTYTDAQLRVPHGTFRFYHPNGKLESQGVYTLGLKQGVWQRFDHWGRELAEKVYNPEPLKEIIYTQARTMPRFPGGEKELVRYLRQHAALQQQTRNGPMAEATFIVEPDGRLSDVRITRAANAQIETGLAEALMSSPRWEPGEDNGRQVRVRMRVPIP
ncbi:MAG: hypothetical protein JNM31_11775 [Flavobacteriales bacterium]|nr:hypothetical protein [Flavobacteriales bacterium]